MSANFKYSTTAEARESLKKKSFYKECMALKESSEWSGRQAMPMKWPCIRSVWYGSKARKYLYDVKLNKVRGSLADLIFPDF